MTLGGQHLCKDDGDVYIQTFIISYLLETANPSCLELEFFLSKGDLILEIAISDFQIPARLAGVLNDLRTSRSSRQGRDHERCKRWFGSRGWNGRGQTAEPAAHHPPAALPEPSVPE